MGNCAYLRSHVASAIKQLIHSICTLYTPEEIKMTYDKEFQLPLIEQTNHEKALKQTIQTIM